MLAPIAPGGASAGQPRARVAGPSAGRRERVLSRWAAASRRGLRGGRNRIMVLLRERREIEGKRQVDCDF